MLTSPYKGITLIYIVVKMRSPYSGYLKPDIKIAYDTEQAALAWKNKQPIPSYYAVIPVELVTHTEEQQ